MKAAFLDRDGVINYDYGYVYKLKDFRFCKGIFKGLKILMELDFNLIIVTNQSGIARGLFTEEEYKETTNFMLDRLKDNNIKITKIYHCPHHPSFPENQFSDCSCRKPKPGLFLKASKEHNIEMHKSIAIGDSERDLIAARSAGIKKRFLIRKDNLLENQNLATSIHKSVLECANTLKKSQRQFDFN